MTTPDRFSGDPRILIGSNGADLDYEGGQPIMDAGLENQALISLFTREGWCGNAYLPTAEQIGSDFEEAATRALNLQTLTDIQNAAERALASDLFPQVVVAVSNPVSTNLKVVANFGQGPALTLDRRGMLWAAQGASPASGRLVKVP